jgi:hypothetical protein
MLKAIGWVVAITLFIGMGFESQVNPFKDFGLYVTTFYGAFVSLFQAGGFMIPNRARDEYAKQWAESK